MTYTPKPGSVAERAMQVLEGGPQQARPLCASLKIKRENLNGNIATAIKAGMIVREVVDGRVWFKRAEAPVPQPVCAAPTSFMSCLWDDGCLDIYPTLALDGGGFRLDTAQVERLRCLLSGVPE